MKTKLIPLALLMFLAGCIGSSKFEKSDAEQWKPVYLLQAGVNNGGITENTDFSTTPDVKVDAFTGASKIGANIGAHVKLPIRKNAIESGIDFMYNAQTFTYADPDRAYVGTRKLGTSQLMIPLTYNIGLFRQSYYSSLIYLKVGYLAQFNFYSIKNDGQLPPYSTKFYSGGFTAGISSTPFKLKNGASLGMYLDVYRGSKAFDDFYNSKLYDMPATSFYKIGFIYQFK